MKKILFLLLLFPAVVFAGTNDQLPDASRTDWLFVQQTWGGGATTRGAVTAQMIIDLINADDIDGLAVAVSGNADVIASFKDAATVIAAIDTYFGSANWRADLVALVAANTAKTGITAQQATDITTNNAKTGITAGQAAEITTNTAKVTYPGAELTADELAAINNASAPTAANPVATMADIGAAGGGDMMAATYDPGNVSNNAFAMDNMVEGTTTKILTAAERAAIVTNTAKTGITAQQATDITANNAKTGITSGQAAEITANTAKVTYPGAELTADELAAINNSAAPTAANPMATMADVGGGGAVDSVFGRTGAITAQTGDYTPEQVGLNNVDNTADANKPVSSPQQTVLDGKSNTTHNHPGVYEPSDATIIKQADVDDTPVSGATTVPVSSNRMFDHEAAPNPHGIDAAAVGLGNVNNTSDANKPISTAQQTALDAKLNTADAGTAALLDTGLTIGDVVAVVDVGYCSDTQYTEQSACESNSGTWTPVAGLQMTAINLPTAAGFQVAGVALTATDIGGATTAQGSNADTAYGWGNHSVAGYLSSESDATAMGHLRTTLTATAANSFSAGSVGFISSAGTVTLADASAEATAANMLVIATASISGGASGTFAMSGLITATAHGYTLGSPLFLSETVGALTTTAPTTSAAIVRVVGYAVDANTLYLRDDSTFVEVN